MSDEKVSHTVSRCGGRRDAPISRVGFVWSTTCMCCGGRAIGRSSRNV